MGFRLQEYQPPYTCRPHVPDCHHCLPSLTHASPEAKSLLSTTGSLTMADNTVCTFFSDSTYSANISWWRSIGEELEEQRCQCEKRQAQALARQANVQDADDIAADSPGNAQATGKPRQLQWRLANLWHVLHSIYHGHWGACICRIMPNRWSHSLPVHSSYPNSHSWP